MAESFDMPASWIAELLQTDEKRLCHKFRSWNAWIDGHEPLALALQKKIRSDKTLFEFARYKITPAKHADLLSINCAQ